ncbi:conserved hypothetical protein [Paraburkholderia tropica]|uniref:hypothetical protein n=1 Tax=Paraburkholderia tropica TaxID=92647 RepID=UPI001CB28032|nr:hypothetical protein [Paraburkholderia tropica]CAG9237772.1 conserved hypothetical protein [Paraburkholderia tropica]
MYDVLEVLFFRTGEYRDDAGRPQEPLVALQHALGDEFEVEPLEVVSEDPLIDHARQVVRIIASTEEFEEMDEFEAHVRELADEDRFPWKRIGAVPVGETEVDLG